MFTARLAKPSIEWNGCYWEFLDYDIFLRNAHDVFNPTINDSGQTGFNYQIYGGGQTGGNLNHTHTTNATITGDHTLTINEMPVHNHTLNRNVPYGIPYNNTGGSKCGDSGSGPWYGESYDPFSIANAGGLNGVTQPHNNLPPYITVYMYKRIA